MKATESKLKIERVGEGFLGFMFQVSAHCAVTEYALERSGVLDRECSPAPPPSFPRTAAVGGSLPSSRD